MAATVKYPVGQQSFESLREGGFLYVDKTRYIETIVNGSQYYFLGRPRRFGKSLFLSTLKCFFEGRRELFRGLYADTMEWDWEKYPVLYLDLNTSRYDTVDELDDLLEQHLLNWEREYGVTPDVRSKSVRFGELIRQVSLRTGKRVVILVDEYDKPLVNALRDKERFMNYRNALAGFYSNFKSSAQYIRLVFLTGVTRFGKLSVFSDLNNLSDISMLDKFAGICGITEEELLTNFREGIEAMAGRRKTTPEGVIAELKRRYDGYHFSGECPDIYNPFSLMNVFNNLQYGNYWIASGTPTLLLEQLKRTDADLSKVMYCRARESQLSGLDIDNISPVPLLYQTGYVTIKDYLREGDFFYLGIPNSEVEEGFLEFLLPAYANLRREDAGIFVFDLLTEIREGRVDDFMRRLQSLFSGTSYEMRLDEERNVQNVLYMVFRLVGLNTEVEYRTSDGRIDILVRTPRYVYIMELKYDRSAEEALRQIEERGYALPWAVDGREVIAIGISYSTESRTIDSWQSQMGGADSRPLPTSPASGCR